MHYETPEFVELGAAEEMTLGSCGCHCDCCCGHRSCCGGGGGGGTVIEQQV